MGAGVALNFTLRFPERVLGLVLSRPVWLDQPLPQHLEVYLPMAALIRRHGATMAMPLFKQSEEYALMRRLSPETADSLVKQFEHPRAEEAVERLERIARDVPNHDRREWACIQAPTLILANRQDPIHLFEYGQTLANSIPRAEFQELTPKSISKEQHASDTQKHIENFLSHHFSQTNYERTPSC
jgi:pimeloyl-ACP methyl ester carboxylesterase